MRKPLSALDQMEQQVRAVLDGSHPRTESIRAIVEDPDYHARLLQHIIDFRRDPHKAERLVRENIVPGSKFEHVERTFGTVPNAMSYFSRTLASARLTSSRNRDASFRPYSSPCSSVPSAR